METNKIEKANYTKITQAIMDVIMNHGGNNKELQKELFDLIELVKSEQRKADEIKALAFELANKLS